MSDDRFDLTGFGADEDFDSFLDSIRRDLGEPERPRRAPSAGTVVIDAETKPAEPEPEQPIQTAEAVRQPERVRRQEQVQEPEPVPVRRPRERIKPSEPETKPRRRAEQEPVRRQPVRPKAEPEESRLPVRQTEKKPQKRREPEIRWEPPAEEDEEKHGLSGFGKAMLVYCIVLIIAVAAALAVFWKYLEAYEFTRPERVMEQFEQMADEKYWQTAIDSAFTVTPTEFETKSALENELCLDLIRNGGMSYVADEAYTDAAPVYLVSVGGTELCRVYLSPQLGGEAGFGLEYMSIDKVELLADFINPEPRTLSITAPADATVTVNGITVSESYISSEAPDASCLPELEQNAAELLRRYDIPGIYGTVEIGASSADGEVLTAESSDENGAVFALAEGTLSYTVYAPEGAVVSINGVELDESYLTGETVTASFLAGLESYGTAPELVAWQVDGLHLEPEVTVTAADGSELGAPYAQDGVTAYLPASDAELEAAQKEYSEGFFKLYAAFESNLNDKIDTNYYNMINYLYGTLPLTSRLGSEYIARTPAGGVTDTGYDSYELTNFVYYGENCYGCNVSLYEDGEQTGGCIIIFTRINAKWYPAEVVEYSF